MTEMRAVGFTEFGDPSVLKSVTLPVPSPGPGQVRVHVTAATVNPTDIAFRFGGRYVPVSWFAPLWVENPPFAPRGVGGGARARGRDGCTASHAGSGRRRTARAGAAFASGRA